MRLVVNLSTVFSRLPLLERFDAAARASFDRVELWWPRAEFEAGLSDDALVAAARDAGVAVAMLNFDGGHLPAGDRGLAGDPARVAEFRANVPHALELADRLGCAKLNALAGRQTATVSLADHLAVLADAISFAASASAMHGATVLVEPLNAEDTPGYLVPDVPSALSLLMQVAQPNVKLQFDVYHVVRSGADPIAAARSAAGQIGHVQVADVPGRHEPGTGGLAFGAILEAVREAGYDDDVGLEYVPTTPESPDFRFVGSFREVASGSPPGAA